MNYASWSITTNLNSASAVSVRCWAFLDPRSITGPRKCANRRCGSWPRSTVSIWKIPAAAAAGWWSTWPEKGSRSAVTGCETSCAAWVYERSTRSLVPRLREDPAKRFPCLVDLKLVTAVDQVWATDITYIPLHKGFLYLVAIVDLFSRNILSWKLSNSLDTEFCLDALEIALEGGRKPGIFHSDQGCQFTSADFVAKLQGEEIRISWSGQNRCYDNILVERLWRTVKYEEVYLRAYSDGWEAEISLARFLWRYCHVRPHSALGGRTPHEVYTETEPCSSRPRLTMSGARTVQ